jgi:hypothetical protein
MRFVEKLPKSRYIDWLAVSAWITGEIATTLQASTEFMGAETLREQLGSLMMMFHRTAGCIKRSRDLFREMSVRQPAGLVCWEVGDVTMVGAG